MCDCWLGILNDYSQNEENNMTISNIKRLLIERSQHTFYMSKVCEQFKSFMPRDYLDRRRWLATLFNFCPLCGAKINWHKIKKDLY